MLRRETELGKGGGGSCRAGRIGREDWGRPELSTQAVWGQNWEARAQKGKGMKK